MQQALKIVEDWYGMVNLIVRPKKIVLVSFTERRNLDDQSFIGIQLHQDRELKYLGAILDTKLTWNYHMQKAINKKGMALLAVKRGVRKIC